MPVEDSNVLQQAIAQASSTASVSFTTKGRTLACNEHVRTSYTRRDLDGGV